MTKQYGAILCAIIVVAVGTFWYGYSTQEQSAASTTSETAASSQTQVNQVALSDIELNKNQFVHIPDQYVFTANVQNNSPYPFAYLHITVNAFDCPSAEIDSSCTQIGQDSGEIAGVGEGASIPSDQERQVTAFINLTGMPAVQDYFEWNYTVDSIEPSS